jgi:hypothetical protein
MPGHQPPVICYGDLSLVFINIPGSFVGFSELMGRKAWV